MEVKLVHTTGTCLLLINMKLTKKHSALTFKPAVKLGQTHLSITQIS